MRRRKRRRQRRLSCEKQGEVEGAELEEAETVVEEEVGEKG